jgi:hypothetical protein
VNHGCNGTNNVGDVLDFTELSIEPDAKYESLFDNNNEDNLESDYFDDRHFNGWPSRANVDIEQNDEILDNYIGFIGPHKFHKYLHEAQAFCKGMYGRVSQYEMNKNAVETQLD